MTRADRYRPNVRAPLSLILLQWTVGLCMAATALPLIVVVVDTLTGHPLKMHFSGTDAVKIPLTPAQVWGMVIGTTLVVEWLAWLLLRVIHSAAHGQVFSARNVRDLRRLGWAALLYGLSGPLLTSFLTGGFKLGGQLNLDFKAFFGSPFSIALIFFAFSEVLRQGQRLREEQDLTV